MPLAARRDVPRLQALNLRPQPQRGPRFGSKTTLAAILPWILRRTAAKTGKARRFRRWLRCSALQPPIALAVITATLFDPAHAAIAIAGLVGIVLIKTGVQPRSSRRFL